MKRSARIALTCLLAADMSLTMSACRSGRSGAGRAQETASAAETVPDEIRELFPQCASLETFVARGARPGGAPFEIAFGLCTCDARDLGEWARRALPAALMKKDGGRGMSGGSAVERIVSAIFPESDLPRCVTVVCAPTLSVPAMTVGEDADLIILNAEWYRENMDGEAAGAFVHEVVHALQRYSVEPGATEENCPEWLCEGIADYARWYLFEPESNGCEIACDEAGDVCYNMSYRVTASFLDFVERGHPGTVAKANSRMRAHAFDDSKFWKETTGLTADELQEKWRMSLAAK